jgi:diacylglycerol kinase (CTP)
MSQIHMHPQFSEVPEMKVKSDIHLARKIWHCTGICLMAAIFNFGGRHTAAVILAFISGAIIPLDFLRQTRPNLNRATMRVFGPVMRKHEMNSLSGFSYLLLGAAFLLLFFEPHIITLTLLFLAFGDPFASFCGIRYGKDRILGNKTLQGTMGAFAICTLLAAIYYYFNNLMIERLLIVAPVSGLIGAVAELIPIGKLDDNLTFPIVASCLLWFLFKVYGGFGL